jgi:catechol 2,3-dioxygenase-like lactoylglutathione lyase family enzyme
MPAKRLDHYNIWSTRLDETVRFYVDVLGLTVGPRPPFGLPGAWLYDSTNSPVVHLVDVAKSTAADRAAAGNRDITTLNGSGAIDHVAFEASDFEDLCSRLRAAGLKYREDGIPSINLRQIFVNDPNGVQLELNFRGAPAG